MFHVELPQIKIQGTEYYVELGTVGQTFLGFEDHGLFTFNLDFSFYPSSGQGFGYRIIQDTLVIKNILRVMNVTEWSVLKGRQAYVLRSSRGGLIDGLLSFDQRKVYLPEISKEIIE